jgi:hypothetical protein
MKTRVKLTKPAATREQVYVFAHVVLSAAKSSAAKSAVICFEWLQRPENVVAGHIKWTGYRTGSKPTIRIEHHKPGAVIDRQLESGILVGRALHCTTHYLLRQRIDRFCLKVLPISGKR